MSGKLWSPAAGPLENREPDQRVIGATERFAGRERWCRVESGISGIGTGLAKTDISHASFDMAVTLLALPNGGSSLEFGADDSDTVRDVITTLFGQIAERRSASYSDITFGGESFLLEWEWDEPCLIATSARGSELLSQIEEHLNG